MMTMGNGQADQLDDLCDARATVRTLRKEVLKRRIALNEAKEKLLAATNRMEDVLTEIEQHQGRLPFTQAEEVKPAAAPEPAPPPRKPGRKPRVAASARA